MYMYVCKLELLTLSQIRITIIIMIIIITTTTTTMINNKPVGYLSELNAASPHSTASVIPLTS